MHIQEKSWEDTNGKEEENSFKIRQRLSPVKVAVFPAFKK